MLTNDTNETPKRRLEDHTPDATIDWTAPDAPAVPLFARSPSAANAVSPRFVASMLVDADGVSVFPTEAAKHLPNGHYVLSTGTAAPTVVSALPRGVSDGEILQLAAGNDIRVRLGVVRFARAVMAAAARPAITALAAQPVEAAGPTDELRRAVREMARMLEENEWAEQLLSDPDAVALESEITRLVGLYNGLTGEAAGSAAKAEPTFMADEQAEKWAWEQVKRDVGTKGWTVGESCTYFGFFLWGWRYRAQYERQCTAQPASSAQVAKKEFDTDEMFDIASGRAEETSEDGSRKFTGDGLIDFSRDLLERFAAPATKQVAQQHIPRNFTTHRNAWRDAITFAMDASMGDGAAYWKHELDAYDRAFSRLLDKPEAARATATVSAAAPADSLVHRIADRVMANLEDRKGVFEDIDDEIMQEIRDDLGNTIRKAIATHKPTGEQPA